MVVACIALRIDVEADDDFAAVALLKVGLGIDEVLRDVFLRQVLARNGFRNRDLCIRFQPNGKKNNGDERFKCFHSFVVLMMQN